MKRKGVQILEEALLILVAFIAIGLSIAALGQIQDRINEFIDKIWEGLNWLYKTMFYFLPD
ncbi:MAG TPA: hypothetical protein ENF47_02770 [Thermoprotei archaeon]|nr:hypothetical protein [Thermoprotei archaeon]